jgi:hypothetical protein
VKSGRHYYEREHFHWATRCVSGGEVTPTGAREATLPPNGSTLRWIQAVTQLSPLSPRRASRRNRRFTRVRVLAGSGRDGLRSAREARGARRGDPRCHVQPLALVPVGTGRAYTRKSPKRSSQSSRPAASPGFSRGGRWQRKRRSPCRRMRRPTASTRGSTCSSFGVR